MVADLSLFGAFRFAASSRRTRRVGGHTRQKRGRKAGASGDFSPQGRIQKEAARTLRERRKISSSTWRRSP